MVPPRPGNHPPIHAGEDIAGIVGASQIHATAAGRVIFSGRLPGYGLIIKIDHGAGVQTWYAHNLLNWVDVGDEVEQGEVIGVLGQSGNARGQPASEAHVHFEVRINGHLVDPANWLNLTINPN
jgi:murein DD-endopeptidase MepM/ murein hydrolase activator NlpD